MNQKFHKPPDFIYLLIFFFIASSVISGIYFLEITASCGVLLLIFILFYQENRPPVIIAALSFQWLSISIGYIYLLFFDATQTDLLWRPAYSLSQIDQSFWLSIYGLLAFSIGLKLATFNLDMQITDNQLLKKYDTLKVILLYVTFSIVFEPLARFIRFSIPGLFQAFNTLTFFKWSLFFLMVYISFKKKEYTSLVYAIIGVEVLLGFTGYFSEFKTFMILFPVVYLSFNKITSPKHIFTLVIIGALLINIGAIWSYVKVEYRTYLSGGERAQIVTVSKQDALGKLLDLSLQINKETYQMGFEAMIKRIYFLEYFSATINNIPYLRPHLEGEIWQKSLGHIFMPRIFFPNKEAIDDSHMTYLLTSIDVADAKQGTSISTGYMAESYADFGPEGMHLAIFALGFMLGLIYRSLLNNSLNQLWGFAIIFPMFFLLNINGKSLIKIFGDTAYFFIIFYFLKRFGVVYLDRLISSKKNT